MQKRLLALAIAGVMSIPSIAIRPGPDLPAAVIKNPVMANREPCRKSSKGKRRMGRPR
jgi:hypothetical protein